MTPIIMNCLLFEIPFTVRVVMLHYPCSFLSSEGRIGELEARDGSEELFEAENLINVSQET